MADDTAGEDAEITTLQTKTDLSTQPNEGQLPEESEQENKAASDGLEDSLPDDISGDSPNIPTSRSPVVDDTDDDQLMIIETDDGLTLLDNSSYYFVHDHEGQESHSGESTSDTYSHPDRELIGEGSITEELMMNLQRMRRVSTSELPDTVTRLETPDGCCVYLIGTAHFSKESQDDVAKTIQAVQPDAVLVELCKSRVDILKYDEEFLLREAKNIDLQKLRLAIKQSGLVGGIMQVLLLSMSAHITQQLGMAPGGEFRAAFKEARKLGCQIHLGDRPIQITLSRAMAALSVWQKIKLAWHLITTKEPISPEDVERCKQKDLLAEMLAEMTGDFPLLYKVFVTERDLYLARSLRLSAQPIIMHNEEGESQGLIPSVTVGVVGIGHVAGIVEHFDKIEDIDFQELLRVPESSVASKVMKVSLKAAVGITVSAFGVFLAWGCYKVFRWTSVTAYTHIPTNIPWLK